MINPHDTPANGVGGPAGTHGSHADCVPGYGDGSVSGPAQTAGNTASRQRAAERDQSGGPAVVVSTAI